MTFLKLSYLASRSDKKGVAKRSAPASAGAARWVATMRQGTAWLGPVRRGRLGHRKARAVYSGRRIQ